jgi:hypothetical protein
MFDNLRDSSFYEDEQNEDLYKEPEVEALPAAPKRRSRRRSSRFLGMTAQQRFLLSFMVLITVCVMGMLAMFVLDKMSLPF